MIGTKQKFSPWFGSTDEELERQCKTQGRFDSGYAPWIAWESENCGFGKAFREIAFYPKILPLFIASDHGIHWGSRCWENEINSQAKYYFTWNKKKSELMSKKHGKESFHVCHPWIHYRKKYFSEVSHERKGTLVFFPHSNAGASPIFDDLDGYFESLKALPEKYQPIVLCLYFHDIENGLHKRLRKYSIPIVTAGISNSQKFVDRFYGLIRKFKYSTSPNIGSHAYYCLEAGVPYFLFGNAPKYMFSDSSAVGEGVENLYDFGDSADVSEYMTFHGECSLALDEITMSQKKSVEKYLGCDSKLSRVTIAYLVWKSLFLNAHVLIEIYVSMFNKILMKILKSARP